MKGIKNEAGFTLIEVVVSIALISVISLGFLQSIVGFSGITKQTIYHDEATDNFAEQIDKNNTPMNSEEVRIPLGEFDGRNYYIDLDQYTIEGDTAKNEGILRYYKYR